LTSAAGYLKGVGHAGAFYATLAASVGLGLAVTLANVSVIGMLVAASVIGGLGTPFGLVLLVQLARDPTVMGAQRASRRSTAALTLASNDFNDQPPFLVPSLMVEPIRSVLTSIPPMALMNGGKFARLTTITWLILMAVNCSIVLIASAGPP
jgi:Mn2+/Fe2+ NRAMP family transporter